MSFLAAGPLGGPATYFTWGWLSVSAANLVVVLATVAVFVLAVLLPFPGHGDAVDASDRPGHPDREDRP